MTKYLVGWEVYEKWISKIYFKKTIETEIKIMYNMALNLYLVVEQDGIDHEYRKTGKKLVLWTFSADTYEFVIVI